MRTPHGQAVFYNSLPLSGCYLPHSALFPPKSVCPSSPPEIVSISAADPPHTEPIPGFSHTEHRYKSPDIQIYPLNTETSSYFHHTQGSYKSCSSVLAESPSAPPPETPCGTNTSSPEILLPPFSEETSAHTSFPP